MTTSPSQLQKTVRWLVVEVVSARDLLPKDGLGTSSPYVIVDFDGQKQRTSTKERDLNPVWNEALEFLVSDPENLEDEDLEIEVFTDRKLTGGTGPRRRQSLGKLKLPGTHFAKKGQERLTFHSLEKKSVFSWIRGELGLKAYYYDDDPATEPVTEVAELSNKRPLHEEKMERVFRSMGRRSGNSVGHETEQNPPGERVFRSIGRRSGNSVGHETEQNPPGERVFRSIGRRSGNSVVHETDQDQAPPCEVVDPIKYIFVRVVKARNLIRCENPYVKIRTTGNTVRSKPAVFATGEPLTHPEWKKVFALCFNRTESSSNTTLEVSICDSSSERFLGGVCFDLSGVPIRSPSDIALVPQWYRLEGADEVSGDIQLAVWIGTPADAAFLESQNSETPHVLYTRPKAYQSPKLWYLRVSVIEAQDLLAGNPSSLPSPSDIRVRAQLGFQWRRSRQGSLNKNTSSFLWVEDFIFVAAEPLDEELVFSIEDNNGNNPVILGRTVLPLACIDQRLDDKHVAAKWFGLEKPGPDTHGLYCGRIFLRPCLEGGYHVLDESVRACSDFRPTAQQLWRPPIGVLELGILGAHALPPMKSRAGSTTTDAYCVGKYGQKWVRTRTIMDSSDPRWNEQYTWQIYDPCTVLTVVVFDNWRMFDGDRSDTRIGKIRIRVSTLETNRVYTGSYPLLVLLRTGLRRMGEIELAVRFACPTLMTETYGVYRQPTLPRMHYVRPLGNSQKEPLRAAAAKLVATWLAKADPPLGSEVVSYVLDADCHAWSMRRSKANWIRIVAVLGWVIGLGKWIDGIRKWKNPVSTVLVHLLHLVLVWYPELIAPTGILYIILVSLWYYRFRSKNPMGMDIRISQAGGADPDELDEEFDPMPSAKAPDIVRLRYDRMRMMAARVQTLLGDLATQGERLEALVSWRDPRATRLFVVVCVAATVVLYSVPPKMVAVALGFYFLRHPMFRDPMPSSSLNFFRRLPCWSDRLL